MWQNSQGQEKPRDLRRLLLRANRHDGFVERDRRPLHSGLSMAEARIGWMFPECALTLRKLGSGAVAGRFVGRQPVRPRPELVTAAATAERPGYKLS